jgi:pyruvate dehydrogenase E1 component alpha subunit
MEKKDYLKYYGEMLKIRYFEEKIGFLFTRALIFGTCHLCIGQEAVAVGACAAIAEKDLLGSTHRGHGHALARGLETKKLMAELLGRETGYCRGKGGTQHICYMEKGFLGTNGITGGGVPVATGAALSAKMRNTGQVVLSFFGDGATNQGSVHEALNFGAIWKLPIVYICENNLYGMSGPVEKMTNVKDLAQRSVSYGMPSLIVDGNDVLAMKEAVMIAAKRAREGEGPTFIECKTYRQCGHSKSDMREYRTREEEKEWLEKDPIKMFKEKLLKENLASSGELSEVEKEMEAEIEEAVKFALESPWPKEEELLKNLYQ